MGDVVWLPIYLYINILGILYLKKYWDIVKLLYIGLIMVAFTVFTLKTEILLDFL